jgi:ribosomal protein S18 acetylase RimI-like enzyme
VSPTRFEVVLPAEIRLAREEDLRELEWFGIFTPHRELIREAFERQQAGEVLMLVAEVQGFPAGQLWVDLQRSGSAPAAYLWALRVFPVFQGAGIGTRLLDAAEVLLRERGVEAVEIGVEADNRGARRLYERREYHPEREEHDNYEYVEPGGERVHIPVHMTILRKSLVAHSSEETL